MRQANEPGSPGAADVIIATTSTGQLYLITIPVTAAFAPRWTLLRASTCAFDDLIASDCQGHYALIAVRRSTQRAYLYRLDTIAGTSSVIRSDGASAGTWASVRSSGRWNSGSYPTRW